MINIIRDLFLIFTYETEIADKINTYQEAGVYLLFLLGVICCFLGFRGYRSIFSIIVFMAFAYVSCILWKDKISWGSVVTLFSVLGTVTAVMSYQWHRLGGFITCGLIGAAVCWLLYPSAWIAVIPAVLLGVFELLFPVIAICFSTSVFGAVLLTEFIGHGSGSRLLIFFLLAGIGIAVQLKMNTGQTLFAKTCPKEVAYRLEKRKLTRNQVEIENGRETE